jgi:hypothetical protein
MLTAFFFFVVVVVVVLGFELGLSVHKAGTLVLKPRDQPIFL